MAYSSFELRELFHLNFLRHLSVRLSGRAYAVKGGICLRFFHSSPRLSEDIDLDVISKMQVSTLGKSVDGILESHAFQSFLISQGITQLTYSRPKQTETTQRWKISMVLGANISLPTKIEFSRRQSTLVFSKGMPDSHLLNHYKLPPFAAQFYDAPTMISQKIEALASPHRNATRDLFDLYHLFLRLESSPKNVLSAIDKTTLKQAVHKISRFERNDFNEQVLPYLTADLISFYKDPEVFEKLKKETEEKLL